MMRSSTAAGGRLDPICTFTIRKTNSYLKIPSTPARRYLKKCPRYVTLSTDDNRIWCVELIPGRYLLIGQCVDEVFKFYNVIDGDSLTFAYYGDDNFGITIKNDGGESKVPVPADSFTRPAIVHEPCRYVVGSYVDDSDDDTISSGDKSDSESDDETMVEFFTAIASSSRSCGLRVCDPAETPLMHQIESDNVFRHFIPNCFMRVRQSDLSPWFCLRLSVNIARSELLDGHNERKLQLYGQKKWDVKCLMVESRAKVAAGWEEFVCDNEIVEGDGICPQVSRLSSEVWNVTINRKNAKEIQL